MLTVESPSISGVELSGQTYNPGSGPVFLTAPAPQSETVTIGDTTTTITNSAGLPASINYGTPVTFNVTVAPKYAGVPTGTVKIQRPAGHLLWKPNHSSAGSGSVTITTLAGPGGSFSAMYGGDTNNKTSTSATVSITVNKVAPPQLRRSPPSSNNTSAYGDNVTFTATAYAVTGGVPPSGTVTFKDGTKTLGTASPTNGVASFTTTTPPLRSVDASASPPYSKPT